MTGSNISRRGFGAVVGASALTTAALSAEASKAGPSALAHPSKAASGLLSPLAAGAKLGSWQVVEISELADGAISVILQDAAGRHFQLDVCARDRNHAGPRGPGETERFDVYLANSGDGQLRTHENHGLAAMAIADVVRGNEANLDAAGFLTLRERERRGLARSRLT